MEDPVVVGIVERPKPHQEYRTLTKDELLKILEHPLMKMLLPKPVNP